MKIQPSIFSQNENLHSTIKTFWANKTLGIKLLENTVLKKFYNGVYFTENRYHVKLSYKENYEIFGDNSKLCKQRLKNLTNMQVWTW